jgi:hypothetical protein
MHRDREPIGGQTECSGVDRIWPQEKQQQVGIEKKRRVASLSKVSLSKVSGTVS